MYGCSLKNILTTLFFFIAPRQFRSIWMFVYVLCIIEEINTVVYIFRLHLAVNDNKITKKKSISYFSLQHYFLVHLSLKMKTGL